MDTRQNYLFLRLVLFSLIVFYSLLFFPILSLLVDLVVCFVSGTRVGVVEVDMLLFFSISVLLFTYSDWDVFLYTGSYESTVGLSLEYVIT